MKMSYRIIPFGEDAPAPMGDLARLHAELLPGSPITKMGPRFMEQFYYTCLPLEGYIFGAVAYVDDRPTGFVTATFDSQRFMRLALRHLWWKMAWVMGLTVLSNPLSITSIWEATSIMRTRKNEKNNQPEGEILSLGVLQSYRGPQFIRKTGLHIVNDLFQGVMDQLQKKELRLIRAFVDADNMPAQLFYHSLGWTLENLDVPGWKVPTVEFIWRP